MGKSKKDKIKDKRGKLAEKDAKLREKLGKCAKCAAVALAAAAIFGCATSEPASRVTKGEYGYIGQTIKIALDPFIGSTMISNLVFNISAPITIGDAAYASADSKGSTETTTASPQNTVTPTTDLNFTKGGMAADAASTAVSAGARLVGQAINAACKDGSCSGGSCSTGNCSGGSCATGNCPGGNCSD